MECKDGLRIRAEGDRKAEGMYGRRGERASEDNGTSQRQKQQQQQKMEKKQSENKY